jgi:AAA family ATP:ADP antiporter
MLREQDRADAAERALSAPGGVASVAPAPGGTLEWFLRPFADVRAGEAPQLLLLALNMFLVLAAYYVMKPVREALILAQPGGAEIKSYAMAVQALLLTVAVPLYGALAARMARRRLINVVMLFFIACLPVFYAFAGRDAPVGVAFLLWIGIFSLMAVAQFWAFAADLYTPEAGKRLFALIAFGASSGAVAGAVVCRLLIGVMGVYPLLLVAAGILVVSVAVFNLAERRARRPGAAAPAGAGADQPIGAGNPFAIVFQHRYLTLMALLLMVLNWTNSTGEYILGSIVTSTGDREIATGQLRPEDRSAFIGHFYAGYFQAINVAGMVLQLFVVSRTITALGVPSAVCVLPLVALGCYGAAALVPSLALMRVVKTTERAVDYSLQNTVSQVLYLPTTRADKYKAKQAIDTFFVRAGDLLSAGTVLVGAGLLALGPAGFAAINVVLVLAWLGLSVAVGREFARRVPARGGPSAGGQGGGG